MVEEFERVIEKVNVNIYEVFASVFHLLRESYILDSGFFIYMIKDKYWFFRYKPASLGDRLKYRGGYMVIQGYRNLDIQFIS